MGFLKQSISGSILIESIASMTIIVILAGLVFMSVLSVTSISKDDPILYLIFSNDSTPSGNLQSYVNTQVEGRYTFFKNVKCIDSENNIWQIDNIVEKNNRVLLKYKIVKQIKPVKIH